MTTIDKACGVCGIMSPNPHNDADDCIKALAERYDSLAARERRLSEKIEHVMDLLGLDPMIGEP